MATTTDDTADDERVRHEVEGTLDALEAQFALRAMPMEDVDAYANALLPFGPPPDQVDESREQFSYVSDALYLSRKRTFCTVQEAFRTIVQLLDLEKADQIPSEFGARINRLYEIIFYAQSMQECKRRLHELADPAYNYGSGISPIVFGRKLFQPHLMTQTQPTPYQSVILTCLHELSILEYRRYKDCCYEKVLVDGKYTYSWRRVCTIAEFVWRTLAAKETQWGHWDNATRSRGNIDGAIEHLKNAEESEFRTLRKNRRMLAFRNGLLVTAVWDAAAKRWRSHFEPFGDRPSELVQQLCADGSVAAKFHNGDYPLAGEAVLTPAFDKLLDHQEWEDEVRWWLIAFSGRMLHPVGGPNRLDRWQVIAFNVGLGCTGKSTLMNDVIANFFSSDDVAYIENNIERQFGWSECAERYIWLASELRDDFGKHCDQTQWQKIVEGGRMSTARKHKTSVQMDPFECSGMMAGNTEDLGFTDNGDGIRRRIVEFYWGETVHDVDVDMGVKLEHELPHIIARCNEAYLEAVNRVASKVWNYLPAYFHRLKAEAAEQSNALLSFLAVAPFDYDRKYYMYQTDFMRLFRHHCRENDFSAKTLKKDYFAGPFSAKGMWVTKTNKADPSDPSTYHVGPWVTGCRIQEGYVEPKDIDDEPPSRGKRPKPGAAGPSG